MDVTNTGAVAGQEIVRIYVHDRAELVRPPKELKGFAKVALQPGETKTVQIALDFRAFAYYHPGYHRWITEDGDFDILAGASAADIRDKITVTLRSTLELPSLLNRESTLGDWMADPRAAPSSGLCARRSWGHDAPHGRQRRRRRAAPSAWTYWASCRDAAAQHPPLPGRRAAAKPGEIVDGLLAQAGRLAVRQASTSIRESPLPGRIFANRLAACLVVSVILK